MITDADVKKLKQVFATKDDLKGFATKDDLKGFATKDDLKGFATKDDLKNYASRDDLVSFKDEILHELRGIRDDMTILTGYKDEIEDHDVRIEHLEKHLHITPIA